MPSYTLLGSFVCCCQSWRMVLAFKWRSVNVKVIWQLNSAIVLCMTSKKWVKAFLKRRSLPQCQMLEMFGRHKLQQVQHNKHKSWLDKLHYFSSLTIKYRVYYPWLLGSTIFHVWYFENTRGYKHLTYPCFDCYSYGYFFRSIMGHGR